MPARSAVRSASSRQRRQLIGRTPRPTGAVGITHKRLAVASETLRAEQPRSGELTESDRRNDALSYA